MTMAFANRLYVRTFIPETKLGKVKMGMAARVTVDAFPGRDVRRAHHRDLARRRVHAESGGDEEPSA